MAVACVSWIRDSAMYKQLLLIPFNILLLGNLNVITLNGFDIIDSTSIIVYCHLEVTIFSFPSEYVPGNSK